MKTTLQTLTGAVRETYRGASRAGLLVATVTAFYLIAAEPTRVLKRNAARRGYDVRADRGALTLEQAIVTAVLSAAAIALGVIIINAIGNHQSNIK